MEKRHNQTGKILTKVLAGVLAGMMVFGTLATLIWYLFVL